MTVATIAEAELFSGAGIKGVLWTKQPVGSQRNSHELLRCQKKDPTFMFVIDDAQVVDWVEEAAAARRTHASGLVSVYAGMARQGIEGGQPALELAQKVSSSKRMKVESIMALPPQEHGAPHGLRRSGAEVLQKEFWRPFARLELARKSVCQSRS